MIFDCFTFSEELDLLEIRLRLLENVVDWFVLCEAPFTFRGDPKRLAFAESGERFAEWRSKIVHLVYPGPPSADPWQNEWGQRDYLASGFAQRASSDDLVLLSDCDEVPDPRNVTVRPRERFLLGHRQRRSHGYINRVAVEPWVGTRALLMGSLARYGSLSQVRKRPESELEFVDGGWHFSSFGGADVMRAKMRSYAHSEYDIPYLTDAKRLEICHASEHQGVWVPLDESYPPIFQEPEWSAYVWRGAAITNGSLADALEHAHGCFAYVPDGASAVSVVANENLGVWEEAGRERFADRFAGVFEDSDRIPALEDGAWIVTDALDDRVLSRACGIIAYGNNARSFRSFESALAGQAFPNGPAVGAREFRARLEGSGRAPDRVDRILRGGVFAQMEKIPEVLYEVVLGTVLRIDVITRDELADFLANALILRWQPQPNA
ncbi:MAG TPA: hypothetical protein VGG22_05535 [Candidatus Baltobacteraceae bacterium]